MQDNRTSMFRWYLDIEKWNPLRGEFQWLLQIVCYEMNDVTKFRQVTDQKRALVSRLMQRRMCQLVLGTDDYEDLEIRRTKGKKPFLLHPRPAESPNFNFNISHEGCFVVCASETTCVCGVDVAAPREARRGPRDSCFLKDFREQLTSYEFDQIQRCRPDDQYEMFQRFWSCKEAFVKARGDGLVYPFDRIEFDLTWRDERDEEPLEVTVKVDGKKDLRWRLHQTCLPSTHWVTCARGPIADIQDKEGIFLSTCTERAFTKEEWEVALTAPAPAWKEVTITDLLPERLRSKFLTLFPDADQPRKMCAHYSTIILDGKLDAKHARPCCTS
eukprot:GEMP01023095.1.p1 GENE.GEMP01023095.1~~GEMP01023095.1.p1  ORF type:complete len:329 (+),score=45.28 GEMP01023095.1:284-1270(+)